jgi:two-component sensor histidine kinase
MKLFNIQDQITHKEVEPFGVFPIDQKGSFVITGNQSAGLLHFEAGTESLITVPNRISKSAIKMLIQAPDGSLFASDDQQIFRYNPQNKSFSSFVLRDQHGKEMKYAGRSCFDPYGNIYISTPDNGFYIWNYSANNLTHWNKWDIDTNENKADNLLRPCITDAKGNVWFTASTGIYRYQPLTKKYHHFLAHEQADLPLLTNPVFIAEDKKGHIWITTMNNGLYELWFENGKEKAKNYNSLSKVGLPSDYLYKIKLSPKDSNLLIASLVGLIEFDPNQKKTIRVIDEQRGFYRSDAYNFFVLPNQDLIYTYFGHFSKFNLNSWKQDQYAAPITINSIRILEKEYLSTLIANNYTLNLQHDQNFIQVNFAALSYNNNNKFIYYHQLIGNDPLPVASNNGIALYAALKPGTYKLQLQVINADGKSTMAEQVIIINIQPPFYKTAWFLISVTLGILFLFYVLYRRKLAAVKSAAALKASYSKQLIELELKALRAQMNPHFIFNSLNSIQKYILQNNTQSASQYLTKFSRLIRLILDHSNVLTVSIQSEISLLKLYCEMESMRFNGRFDFDIKVDPAIDSEQILIPSMLIQPYVENAIWHGLLHKSDVGYLSIRIQQTNQQCIMVEIEDDGIGRDQAKQINKEQTLKKKSYGMQITQNRMEVLSMADGRKNTCTIVDKKDEHGNSTGTLVTLIIPFHPTES